MAGGRAGLIGDKFKPWQGAGLSEALGFLASHFPAW
jgi:hypothetical protein